MQSTPVSPEAATVLDLDGLRKHLEGLTDVRHRKGLRYALAPLPLLIVLAKLAGEDRPSGIIDWGRSRGRLLREALQLA